MNILKNLMHLGLGTFAVTKEKAETLANELIKKGEITKGEGKKLIDHLVIKGKKNKKEIESHIEKTLKTNLHKLNIPTKKEVNELKAEIKALKKKLGK